MHELPKLQYEYGALEPYIDARTMELHHSKHHAAYVAKLNEAVLKHGELDGKPVESLISSLASIPEDIKTAVKNHGGGHFNHSFFWKIIGPESGSGNPGEKLSKEITETFGSFDSFKAEFTKSATGHFGSGWTWLTRDAEGRLKISSLPNQDCPISIGEKPLLALDLWEHAYYLKYQNRRPEYVEAWWNIVNWDTVEKLVQI